MKNKQFAVELDFNGRRRITAPRYPSRAEAQRACDRHAPLFRARIVTVRGEPVRPAFLAAFADTVAAP